MEGVEAISDIDRTIDSLRQWRIHHQQQYNQIEKKKGHSFETQPDSISPETEGEIACEAVEQSEQEAAELEEEDQSSGQTRRLIQMVHDVFRDNPIIDRPMVSCQCCTTTHCFPVELKCVGLDLDLAFLSRTLLPYNTL